MPEQRPGSIKWFCSHYGCPKFNYSKETIAEHELIPHVLCECGRKFTHTGRAQHLAQTRRRGKKHPVLPRTHEEFLNSVLFEGDIICPCQHPDVPAEWGCALCEGDRVRTIKVLNKGVVIVSQGVYDDREVNIVG